ncbi:class I SAM-dependent methyltransferase, partial [Klebsiella pneumoniae]
GYGRDLQVFSDMGFQAEGFDASEKMVTLARSNLPDGKTRIWQADFRFLSLPRETYDGIWANQSLIHLSPVLCQRAVQSFFAA